MQGMMLEVLHISEKTQQPVYVSLLWVINPERVWLDKDLEAMSMRR